ncbi:asparaginase domain-containing protein [Demequina sp. NBRC 110057]|uniref:asparaginase domain-containing protein n=1 Tax=Demequina sp. NBRC 110057 TaxID=1570346 RepID=UPI0009FD6521|nr:asparaginase domain-containing protein [Demequina sp. NBRC 110057]
MSHAADVTVIATGGTIDKEYLLAGDLAVGEPAATRILHTLVPSVTVRVVGVLAIDSRDMTDADRDVLAREIGAAETRAIVVTHGTDTMADTAEYLASRVADGVTVVLTGALRPETVAGTDAHVNLGFALAAAQLAGPGVYVAMGARLFAAGTVRKDLATGAFVDVS